MCFTDVVVLNERIAELVYDVFKQGCWQLVSGSGRDDEGSGFFSESGGERSDYGAREGSMERGQRWRGEAPRC